MIRLRKLVICTALFLTACYDTNRTEEIFKRVSGQSKSPYVEAVERLPSFFYRVTASYTLLETGEAVDFDFVVACGGSVTRWTYTSPSVHHSWHPMSMFKATSNGEAIAIRSPGLCNLDVWGYLKSESRYFPAGDAIPDDFLPLTIWYPDVNRLGWGIGYDSDVAYESPHARIAFNGASVTRSDVEEWKAWRARAVEEYEQVGGLPGPWGWQSVAEASEEERRLIKERNGGALLQANMCFGAKRVVLPETIKEQVLSYRPNPDHRFWSVHARAPGKKEAPVDEIFEVLRDAKGQFNGGDYQDHRQHYDQFGVLKRDGGGRVNYRFGDRKIYQDRFPVLTRQLSDSTDPGSARFLQVIILTGSDWVGFTFCGWDEPTLEDIDAYFGGTTQKIAVGSAVQISQEQEALLKEALFVRENGILHQVDQEMWRNAHSPNIIDQQGFIFSDCCSIRG